MSFKCQMKKLKSKFEKQKTLHSTPLLRVLALSSLFAYINCGWPHCLFRAYLRVICQSTVRLTESQIRYGCMAVDAATPMSPFNINVDHPESVRLIPGSAPQNQPWKVFAFNNFSCKRGYIYISAYSTAQYSTPEWLPDILLYFLVLFFCFIWYF